MDELDYNLDLKVIQGLRSEFDPFANFRPAILSEYQLLHQA